MKLVSQEYVESQLVRPSTMGWYNLVVGYMNRKGGGRLTKDGWAWEEKLYLKAIAWPFD